MRLRVIARSTSIFTFAPALALAVPSSSPDAWGTTSDTIVATQAATFLLVPMTPPNSENGLADNGMRSCSSAFCYWGSPLHLPSGARIMSVELSACDGDPDPDDEVQWGIFRQPKPDGDFIELLPPSGTGGMPGCQTFPVTLPTPVVVDNNVNSYVMTVGAPTGTNLGFLSYRVSYRLQVSPAPAVATFADVPTGHPFFRFIEAMAAAGITGGCTPAPSPNFCPDAPITRGQMAVFLSAALGLHFPN
jgi:hypothetical protein